MTRQFWRRLAMRVLISVAVAVVLIVVGPSLALLFHPVLTVVAAVVVAAVVTAFFEFDGPRPTPPWLEPQWRHRSAYMQADIRTRRLAQALTNAKPGADFEARRVATQLADLTSRRLVARGLVPDDDPLAHAAPHLSPALLAYLRSATADKPQVPTRKTLHSHLKEIDSL